ncbi:hypothetical protein [Burkholderia plantarii]|uniref:Bacterial toxin YdaT domain-containing protein n=1 Tax=Burkholderia plantarii TaxID=41899 RepID=A0A0B6RS22_BURPL|nr:hypothetical protein [Burkholderia plantarii]AJK46193.1 hypothetical protein BGL_1c16840 [Burkholderia plantarii]
MRRLSCRTPIAAIKAAMTAWRNAHGWSRETVVEEILNAHVRIGAEQRVGVRFSDHHDHSTRQKANADRVYRWLDDDDNDRNLLSVNMLPSVLAGFPVESQLALLGEILSPLGLTVRLIERQDEGEVHPGEIVKTILGSNHRTESAAADLLDGIDPGELRRLHASLSDEIGTKQGLLGRVEAAMLQAGDGA